MIRAAFLASVYLASICLASVYLVNVAMAASAVEEVSVQATLNVDTVKVAEIFQLTVKVQGDSSTRIIFPETLTTLGPFEIIETQSRMDVPDPDNGDRRMSSWIANLETIDSGALEIPPLEIVAIKESGQRIQLKTSAIQVTVVSGLAVDTAPDDFRDIQSEIDVSIPAEPSYQWLIRSIVSLAGLACVLTLFLKLKRRQKWIATQRWANDQLKTLRSSEIVKAGDSKQALGRLESIVRTILQSEFSFNAEAATTSELNEFADNEIPPSIAQPLQAFFSESERARYAGIQQSPAELNGAIERVEKLVNDLCQVNPHRTDVNTREESS